MNNYISVGEIIINTEAIVGYYSPEQLVATKKSRRLNKLARDEIEDYIADNAHRYEPARIDPSEVSQAVDKVLELFNKKIEEHRRKIKGGGRR